MQIDASSTVFAVLTVSVLGAIVYDFFKPRKPEGIYRNHEDIKSMLRDLRSNQVTQETMEVVKEQQEGFRACFEKLTESSVRQEALLEQIVDEIKLQRLSRGE